jgi:hypothetical protein
MPAVVSKVLAHRACRIRSDVQKRRRIGRAGSHNDAVPERVGFLENADDLRNRRLLLADRVVDADHVLVALVDDRVNGDGSLPRLTVADDQLALPAADGHHRVDGFQTSLQRLADRLSIDDARRDTLDRHERLCRDRSFAVDRLAKRVHDAAEQLFAYGHRDDAAGALDDVPFLDLGEFPEEHRAHTVLFEIQRYAEDAVRKFEHLTGHRPLYAVNARDAVTDGHDAADFCDVDLNGVAADLLADDL